MKKFALLILLPVVFWGCEKTYDSVINPEQTNTIQVTDILPIDSGTVSFDPPGGSYLPGTTVSLTPTPAAGYSFDSWTGDLTGSDNPASIIMDSNKNITANFISIQ